MSPSWRRRRSKRRLLIETSANTARTCCWGGSITLATAVSAFAMTRTRAVLWRYCNVWLVSVCLCAWLFRVPSAIHAYRQQLGAHDAVQANERAIARLSEVITRRIKTTNTRAMALAAKAADLRRQIDDERREIVRGGWSRRQYGATVHCSGGRSSCICTCVHVGCRAVVVADAVA